MGGSIIFEFREPLEFVKAMTFIDIKGPENTPDVTVFFDGGRSIIVDTLQTGGNGVYTLPFKTSLYKAVTRIEVKIENFGAVSSLEYPYCVKPRTPAISIKKYAGPPNLCTPSGTIKMQDDQYTVPHDTQWAYCYVISVPSDSEECLYDVTISDPGTIGGTNGTINVTREDEILCPRGMVKYMAGPLKSFAELETTESAEASVEGYGYYSGSLVTNGDGASVTRQRLPTPRPNPPPTGTPTHAPVTTPPPVPTVAPVPNPSDPTPAVSPSSPPPPLACPLINLNFTNLPNPMARYYGQESTLQAGDYLLDQPWWTHGVKVSARIRESGHRDNDDTLFIPRFSRGTGWIDSKLGHNVTDHKTGGAIRLLDTMRPSYNSDSKYHQPLCTMADERDHDLGAPNVLCSTKGPGKNSPCDLRLHDIRLPAYSSNAEISSTTQAWAWEVVRVPTM